MAKNSSPLGDVSRENIRAGLEIKFDEIVLGKAIGEGQFGTIYKGRLWGQEVAVKTLKSVDPDSLVDFHSELLIMKHARHPNVVDLLGACFESPNMCLVSEFLPNGNLEEWVQKRAAQKRPLSLRSIMKLSLDLAKGLNWLHHKGIIHRDFKPENILMDEDLNAKIGDFGLSQLKNPDLHHMDSYGCVGTPCYMAPEVIANKKYGVSADVYSFAMVLCELLTGYYPFDKGGAPEKTNDFEAAIVNGLRPPVPEGCPKELGKLMQRCWADRAEDRPLMDEVVQELERIDEKLEYRQHVRSRKRRDNREDRLARIAQEVGEKVVEKGGFQKKRRQVLQVVNLALDEVQDRLLASDSDDEDAAEDRRSAAEWERLWESRNREANKLQSQLDDANTELERTQTKLEESRNAARALRAELKSHLSELRSLRRRVSAQNRQIEELREKFMNHGSDSEDGSDSDGDASDSSAEEGHSDNDARCVVDCSDSDASPRSRRGRTPASRPNLRSRKTSDEGVESSGVKTRGRRRYVEVSSSSSSSCSSSSETDSEDDDASVRVISPRACKRQTTAAAAANTKQRDPDPRRVRAPKRRRLISSGNTSADDKENQGSGNARSNARSNGNANANSRPARITRKPSKLGESDAEEPEEYVRKPSRKTAAAGAAANGKQAAGEQRRQLPHRKRRPLGELRYF